MKKVLIINEGYSNNLGDQAIKKSITSYFENNNYETSFLYFSKPNMLELPKYNYLSTQKSNFNNSSLLTILKSYLSFFYWIIINFNSIKKILTKTKYDYVIIGGGQLVISSGTIALSGFSISMFWFSIMIKYFSNAKLHLIAIGTSSKFNYIETALYRNSFKRVSNILVRDTFSKKIFKKIFKLNVKKMPDIVFYQPKKTLNNSIKTELALIGIANFNEVYRRYNKLSSINHTEYFEKKYLILKKYLDKEITTKLFYTTISDAQECIDFKLYLFKKHNINVEIADINDIDDLLKLYESTNYIYSGRMHALILALKQNCTIEVDLISQKLKSFNNEVAHLNSIKSLSKSISTKLNYLYGNN